MSLHERSNSRRYVSELLAPCPQKWWVAGGWAIDGFLGEVTRDHKDVDVAILQQDEAAFRQHLSQQDWEAWPGMGDGQTLSQPLDPSDQLPPGTKVLLCRPSSAEDWAFEFLLNKADGLDWIFMYHEAVRMPLDRLGGTGEHGTPLLNPEIVLLYKAKNRRDKDEHDFIHAVPRLSDEARLWLATSIAIVHPGHPWLDNLE